MSEANHPAFDKDEQEILSAIVPDAELVEEVSTDQPSETPAPAANAEAPKADAAVEEQPKPEVPETPEPAQPQGDIRAALRASRRAEKRARDELDQVRQENEALKQGKAPVDTSITDAELAELEADFPLQAKIVRKQREIDQQLARQAKPEPQQDDFVPMSYDPAVQEVIDSVPDLLAWQYDPAAQDKFARAVEYDKALSVDPDWKDRDVTERFAEAARRTKAALAPTTPTPAVPAAPRTDPATVIANAPVSGPKSISDFRGGAPASPNATPNYAGKTDEEIMASLPAY